MRRVAVVLNMASGGLLGHANPEAGLATQLRGAGLEATIIPASDTSDLNGRLDRAIAMAPDAVIVGGGDGTICAAAQRLAGTPIALGVLPLGTMNMLAKDLRLPMELPAAMAALACGHLRTIDVAEVNGRVFLCNAVLGLPTAIGRHRERSRGEAGFLGRWRFLVGAFRTTVKQMPMRLNIATDGSLPRTIHTRALVVANNAYSEGFGEVFTRRRLDEGKLVLYVAHHFGAWWSLKMILAMFLGAWRDRPEIDACSATEVVIRSRRPLRVMMDGEAFLLTPPLRFHVRPQALQVIVPDDCDG
ncbi:diacylglycerol/lipid kinase family protein [Teichococcus vastitatis]|uniref:Diacylglycerol kinase n=1 Tax=Teichococcus vastitatis TaxID=2307076 RepID=A0ABS9WB49_9PROT|nr:diacylglycerol kinase family protein [Pseudoroseomonas vastitatis]MCI0756115.1 diacylglycerol kinase [Pseudoroseomonas vastitatis]